MSSPRDDIVFFRHESEFRATVGARLERLRSELAALVPGADVQHVGSTAIPGSLTKGDLDIQVRVARAGYSVAKAVLAKRFAVNEGGFTGDEGISFEDYSDEPSAGIHLTVVGGSADVQSRFRDLLVASAELRRDYDALKRRFHEGSMAEYREAKAAFVARVLDDPRRGLDERVMLYRPVGPKELALLEASGFRRWPPRLPEQPIFYPVTNERYAVEIASRWNVKDDGVGYVTSFAVRRAFMERYEIHVVGAAHHAEWWVPAEDLEVLNDNIVGTIAVIGEYRRPV
jgi:GrpB-like predicted nucleotidyltransferase (UPF0157 family)